MKKFKWLVLSIICYLILLALSLGVGCNIFGTKDWRGDKAAFLGSSLGLGLALFTVTMFLQSIKMAYASENKFWGIFWIIGILVFIFGSVAIVMVVSKQYCQ